MLLAEEFQLKLSLSSVGRLGGVSEADDA